MNRNSNYLLCKKVKFYSINDEDAFFGWIKRLDCIKKIDAAGDELYLDIVDRGLNDQDLSELLGLLYRYKIDMKQLARFQTEENKPWFLNNRKAYWHTKVFGAGHKEAKHE